MKLIIRHIKSEKHFYLRFFLSFSLIFKHYLKSLPYILLTTFHNLYGIFRFKVIVSKSMRTS